MNDGLDSRKPHLSRTSFWCPMVQPTAAADRAPEPPKRPRSPMTGAPLRLKDLLPIDLKPAAARTADGRADAARYLCHVSHKEITTQRVVMLRNTGCVMLETAFEELAKPDMVCPLTSRPFKARDVLELKHGVSGFAASGEADEVQVKKYRLTIR